MRKLLILFFLLIIVVSAANAQVCYFNTAVDGQATVNYEYIFTAQDYTIIGTVSVNNATIIMENAEYFPTYIYSKCLQNCSSGTGRVLKTYYTYNSQGLCTQSYSTNNVGWAGDIKIGDVYAGGFTVYVYGSARELYFYAVYTNLTQGVTYTYTPTGSWPVVPYFCNQNNDYNVYAPYSFTTLLNQSGDLLPAWLSRVKIQGTTQGYTQLIAFVNQTNSLPTYYTFVRAIAPYRLLLNISYDQNKDILTVVINSTVKTVFVFNNTQYTLNAKQMYSYAFVNPQSHMLAFYDEKMKYTMFTLNLSQWLDCYKNISLPQAPEEGQATLKVYSKHDVAIKDYSVIINDNGTITELTTTNYTLPIGVFANKTVQITIKPLFSPLLQETKDITINYGENIIKLDRDYYIVKLNVYFKPLAAPASPIGFNYNAEGEIDGGSFAYGGGGTGSVVFTLPQGVYNLTVSTTILGFTRSKTVTLDLTNEAYYKFVTVTFTPTGEEVQIGESISAILSVYVNGIIANKNMTLPINNATVVLLDSDGNKLAEQKTVNGITRFAGLEIGKAYTVKVYYLGELKAVEQVMLNTAEDSIIITIQLTEQEFLQQEQQELAGKEELIKSITTRLLTDPAIWGLAIVIALAIIAAANAGERIGLITFVAVLGVFTYIIPLLPQVIFIVVAIIAMILFSWKIAGRFVGGGEE